VCVDFGQTYQFNWSASHAASGFVSSQNNVCGSEAKQLCMWDKMSKTVGSGEPFTHDVVVW
jgi:hypothetical protein